MGGYCCASPRHAIVASLRVVALTFGLLVASLPSHAEIGRVRLAFYPNQGAHEHPIIADYTGKLYKPAKPFAGLTAKDLSLPEERVLLQMMNTIRSGTLESFIALWEPSDQDEVRRYYKAQKGLWDKLQKHYKQIPDQRLVNIMVYGSYRMLQILKLPPKLSPYVSTVVLKSSAGGLRLSNDLKGDAVHAYFATEFATRMVEEFMRAKKQGKH
jgi:hypothetical protein